MSVSNLPPLGGGFMPPPARAVSYSPPAFGSLKNASTTDSFTPGQSAEVAGKGAAINKKILGCGCCCALLPIAGIAFVINPIAGMVVGGLALASAILSPI